MKIMILGQLLILLLITVGCWEAISDAPRWTQQPAVISGMVLSFYLDEKFTDGEMREIEKAISEWNRVLNGNMRIEVAGRHNMEPEVLSKVLRGGGYLIMKVPEDSGIIPFTDGSGKLTITLAWCDRVLGHRMYVVDGRIAAEDLKFVLLHEIGHLLGLGHREGGLMHPHYAQWRYLCVDRESALEVGRLWKFDLGTLNYCMRKP